MGEGVCPCEGSVGAGTCGECRAERRGVGQTDSGRYTIPDARNYRFENSLINTVAEGDSCFVNNVFDNSEEEPFGAAHFRKVDHDNFVYDFHLSDSATAKGIAAGRYSELYRFDIDGVERPAANADAGCYQYVEMPVEEDKE